MSVRVLFKTHKSYSSNQHINDKSPKRWTFWKENMSDSMHPSVQGARTSEHFPVLMPKTRTNHEGSQLLRHHIAGALRQE